MSNCTKKDAEFYRRIGSLGGKKTVERHGREHMSKIGRKGFEVTTQRYFRSESDHKLFLAELGAHVHWKSTGLPPKRDRNGHAVFPEKKPTHPAHRDYTEF